MGAAVLLKVYEFRVFDWVGRLPVLRACRVSRVRATDRVVRCLRCSRGSVCMSYGARDLVLRRFLISPPAVALVLFLVFVGHG